MEGVPSHSLWKKGVCLLLILHLIACSSAPTVDKAWLEGNCTPPSRFEPDSCSSFSNCVETEIPKVCSCTYDNGTTYIGQLLNGKWHGAGGYQWIDGTTFLGYWKQGEKKCGVEENDSGYLVYQFGYVTKEGSKTSTGDVIAAVLVGAILIGAAAAAASSGGGSGSSYGDYDWDWDAFYNDNYVLVWRCRGVQTGQFANDSKCSGDTKDDNRWPNK